MSHESVRSASFGDDIQKLKELCAKAKDERDPIELRKLSHQLRDLSRRIVSRDNALIAQIAINRAAALRRGDSEHREPLLTIVPRRMDS